MKSKRCQFFFSLILVLGFYILLLHDSRPACSAQQENHCFTCHTNAQKLIKITREIAKNNKGKPGASTETEGEG